MTLITNMMARIAHRGGDHSYWRDEKPDINNYLEEKLNDKSLWDIILVICKEYRLFGTYISNDTDLPFKKLSVLTRYKRVIMRHAIPFFAFFARYLHIL